MANNTQSEVLKQLTPAAKAVYKFIKKSKTWVRPVETRKVTGGDTRYILRKLVSLGLVSEVKSFISGYPLYKTI